MKFAQVLSSAAIIAVLTMVGSSAYAQGTNGGGGGPTASSVNCPKELAFTLDQMYYYKTVTCPNTDSDLLLASSTVITDFGCVLKDGAYVCKESAAQKIVSQTASIIQISKQANFAKFDAKVKNTDGKEPGPILADPASDPEASKVAVISRQVAKANGKFFLIYEVKIPRYTNPKYFWIGQELDPGKVSGNTVTGSLSGNILTVNKKQYSVTLKQ